MLVTGVPKAKLLIWPHSPFASGVYIPVGYITGRIDGNLFAQSWLSVTAGIAGVGMMGAFLWRRGLRGLAASSAG